MFLKSSITLKSKSSKLNIIKLITVPVVTTNGQLCYMQNPDQIPFDVKRVYYIYGVSEGSIRGGHTHKATRQILFCINSSIKIIVDDGKDKEEILLDKPNVGILLEPGIWHEMRDFKKDTILLVLASAINDSNDYIRNYEDFLGTIYSNG